MKRKYSIFDYKLPENCPQWPDWFVRPKGICLGCGKELGDKRKRYCSDDPYRFDGPVRKPPG